MKRGVTMMELANKALENLKQQPALTVLLVLNVMVLAMVYQATRERNVLHDKQLTAMIERCMGAPTK